jgi:hypothetical protein
MCDARARRPAVARCGARPGSAQPVPRPRCPDVGARGSGQLAFVLEQAGALALPHAYGESRMCRLTDR